MGNDLSVCLDKKSFPSSSQELMCGCAGKEHSLRCGQTGTFHQLHQSQLLSNTSDGDLCMQNRNEEAEWPPQPSCTEVASLKQVPVKNN